jgi:PAS domain S-box-containing protein
MTMKKVSEPDREPNNRTVALDLQRQLRECQARLKGLADNLPGGVVFQNMTTDGTDRRFLYMSESSAKVFGVPAAAIMADPQIAYDLIVEEHREAFAAAEEMVLRHQTRFDGEVQIRRPDGELRWLRMVASPRKREDGSVVYDGVILDTTEQKLAHEAEIRALRYQVNPHFLFNSLSAVSTLILDGEPAQAEHMVMSLASFYRKSLQLDPLQLHPLAEEVGLQKLYLDVEKVRFPDELELEFAIDPTLEKALVPGMVLQPIIENAIKYGMGAAGSRVKISLKAFREGQKLAIVVRNDRKSESRRPGTGFGLKMTRRRLEMVFGSDFDLHAGPDRSGGFHVEMSMPLQFHELQIGPAVGG